MRDKDKCCDPALFLDSADAVLTVKIETLTESLLAEYFLYLEDRESCAVAKAHDGTETLFGLEHS
jgi:hypothetical protein